ncbi:MAG TPA: metal ABC transporter substrate-binding protein [Methylomirabilota bacterium]|nr:metal ABC transporter substrate-binding protein [Methylomirabilota bacterium]
MLLPLLVAATLSVAATTTDLRDLVAAVGGDRVRVESLTDPRQDPHAREIHPRQLALLRSADLLVRVGLDHEPWLARALKSVAPPAHDLDCSRAVALLATETPRLRADSRPHVHAFGNTHYWLDPENARPITAGILEALVRLAPAERAAFEANRARFLARLDAGLARWKERLRPYAGSRVVVVHDTWPYFARRFELTVAAAVEEKPGVPPSPAYLGQLMERMKATGVRVLVAEPGAPAALLRRIAAGTGARVVTLAPSVGSDPEATDYLALFDVNVQRLAAALAGR